MEKNIPLYPWSRKEAQRLGEDGEWIKSYGVNCTCARAIELAIKDGYANNRLSEDCIKPILERFGFNRVNWVLATTIQHGEHDGRYSQENKRWANRFYIPKESATVQHNSTVNAHPGLVDIFTNLARKEWEALGLYDEKHCYDEKMNYTGKVLVLNANILKDECKTPDNQLFYASGGNGCRPEALGVKVFGQHLNDGEKTYYCRSDFIGVMKLDLIPEWAQKRYAELTHIDAEPEEKQAEKEEREDVEQSDGNIGMGGITT